MNILAIIPARGGSVRFPRKNLAIFQGETLLARTIRQALSSKLITRVVVSTEDDDIARAARAGGVEAINRPSVLAQGEPGSVLRVVQHVLAYVERYGGERPLLVVLLQVTSPLRTVDDIDGTIKLLIDTGARSAETQCAGKENGAVYVSYRDVFLDKGRILDYNLVIYEMPPARSIDVDTPADLAEAERIVSGQTVVKRGPGRPRKE